MNTAGDQLLTLVSICTGKSSLTVRFVERHFVESYYPTIENTFSRIIKHNGEDFATEIVDTAGQVRAINAAGLKVGLIRCRRQG